MAQHALDADDRVIYLDQQFVPMNTARISIFDYGYNYGMGVYDVARVEQGRIYQLAEHIARLLKNAAQLNMSPSESAEQLQQISERLVRETVGPHESAIVYYQVSPGHYGRRSHRFPETTKPTVLVYTQRLIPLSEQIYRTGLRVTLVSDDRWDHCDMKTIALCSNVMHFNRCLAQGYDDFVYVNKSTEHVLEMSSSNLFVVGADNTVRTPPLGHHVLPGITRDTLLQVAARAGIAIEETDISKTELLSAREVFVTATTKEIVPVRAVEEHCLTPVPGPVTRKLMFLLAQHLELALGVVHPRRTLLDELQH
jgi:D-alanine transaminase